jgi:predicted TIM-barrel fold metal-dependent hydrolase
MGPIISVHEHIHNARDIPLKGYLKSRKFTGWLKILSTCFIPGIAKCLRRKLDPLKKNKNLGKKWCCFLMWVAEKALGKPYRSWGDTLSKEVIEIAEEMIETFHKDGIQLYVPLMIDYEYWFKNTPDNIIDEQIMHMHSNIIIPYKGSIHPFVSFDPARELAFRKGMENPDGKPEEFGSLNLVKDAIENMGYIGVKVYNAMGYKPFNNALVDEKRRKIALHKKKYIFKGEEYDEVLSELYDYCLENQVPITTHCAMDGSESYPDASFDFGQALFWREVLDQERWAKLRLNLAHFGWNKTQGHQGPRSWVEGICRMLDDYENLYTDVSHHEVMSQKEDFITAYHDLIVEKGFSVIKKKLLFGIDWHVIKRVKGFENFKDQYKSILKHNNLFDQSEIDDFLGRNAIRFLGLDRDGKARQRLKTFYQEHSIDPPDWFASTEP